MAEDNLHTIAEAAKLIEDMSSTSLTNQVRYGSIKATKVPYHCKNGFRWMISDSEINKWKEKRRRKSEYNRKVTQDMYKEYSKKKFIT